AHVSRWRRETPASGETVRDPPPSRNGSGEKERFDGSVRTRTEGDGTAAAGGAVRGLDRRSRHRGLERVRLRGLPHPPPPRAPPRAARPPAPPARTHALGHDPARHASQIVATAKASGIPAVALTAYERAAAVINAADRTCHMPWQLIAAIGRVESDHGRAE